MPGIWGLRLTTIGAICTMFQRHLRTSFFGSAELFPQHCQVPNLSPNAHLKALTKELQTATATAAKTTKGCHLIKSLAMAIKAS
jgi:hypothetical protein